MLATGAVLANEIWIGNILPPAPENRAESVTFAVPCDAPGLGRTFQEFWHTPQLDAVERMKPHRLAWELVGSEFAGRQLQYEKFYAGAGFIVRGHSFREAPWDRFNGVVDDLLSSYTHPADRLGERSHAG